MVFHEDCYAWSHCNRPYCHITSLLPAELWFLTAQNFNPVAQIEQSIRMSQFCFILYLMYSLLINTPIPILTNLLMQLKQMVYHQGKSEGFDSCDWPSNLAQIGFKSSIFQPVWPWNLMDDLKQGKSEGFESCDRPTVRKCPIWVKIGDVLYHVTLKFDGWPWKTIGHLSFAVSSFVQHFIAIGEIKLELQSGNAQFGSNSTIFRAVWP